MDQNHPSRLILHEILCDILGSRNCYFSPPSNIHIVYPCIIYEEDIPSVRHADDKRYFYKKRYSLTIIDENPDSYLPGKLFESDLPYVNQEKPYVADGLNHFPFTLYF